MPRMYDWLVTALNEHNTPITIALTHPPSSSRICLRNSRRKRWPLSRRARSAQSYRANKRQARGSKRSAPTRRLRAYSVHAPARTRRLRGRLRSYDVAATPNLAGKKVIRLIQIFFDAAEFGKHLAGLSTQFAASADRKFEFGSSCSLTSPARRSCQSQSSCSRWRLFSGTRIACR
jgi:hypothetical protein